MKQVPIALACAALVSGGLYGLLTAFARPPSEPEDPWLLAWSAAGLKGQLVGISNDPAQHLMFGGDGREIVKGRAFRDTVLRRYLVQAVHAQVVVFPGEGLAEALPEGRHFGFRLKPKGGGAAHLCRVGRNLLLVKTQTIRIGLFEEMPTPKPFVEKLFDVFEKTAAIYP